MNHRLSKVLIWALIILLPSMVFLNVRRSFQFYQLEREIAALEARQLRMFEANKRAIAGIAVLRSPARIRRVVEEAELPILPLTPEQLIHVRIFTGDGNANSGDGNAND
ncbi:MAG: hypothetical protein EA428_03895 [Spirochaetaceae bacterium]|nr:MAG: hypothetical protein EA428_03895 [Spirochaetaceae bacterium]